MNNPREPLRGAPPPPPQRGQRSSPALVTEGAAHTEPGVSLPVPPSEGSALSPQRHAQSRTKLVVACCVGGAVALGGVIALVSSLSGEETPQAAGGPPTAAPQPREHSTPPEAAPPDNQAAESASAVVEAVAESAGQGSTERTTPTCDELVDAHPAPRKASALDYDFIHHLRTARRELVRGRIDAAHAAFCRATTAPGADVNVWVEYAQLLVLRGDGAAAIPWAERALSVEANNPLARGLLGDALLLAGRTDEARRAWLGTVNEVEVDPAVIDRLVRRNLAEAERALKGSDKARAQRFFRRVLAFDPENARARTQLSAPLP